MTSVSAQADAGVAEGVLRAIESTLPGIQTSDTMQDQITRLIMLLDHLVRCRVYMWHVLNLLFSNKFILRDPNCTFWCDKTLGSTYTTTSLETWIWNMFSIPTTVFLIFFWPNRSLQDSTQQSDVHDTDENSKTGTPKDAVHETWFIRLDVE